MALCALPLDLRPPRNLSQSPLLGILKPGQTMCLSLLLFDSCLLWSIVLYLADWLNYKFIQPSNQETIKQIV